MTSRPEFSLTTGIFCVVGFLTFGLSLSLVAFLPLPFILLSVSLSMLSLSSSIKSSLLSLSSLIFTAAKPISSPMVPLETPSSVLFLINITLAPTFNTKSSWVRTVFFRVSTSLLSPVEVAVKRIISPSNAASSLSLMLLTLRLWVYKRVRLISTF